VALVFCVHHKPWKIMSTLVTVLAQDFQDANFFFIYNVGDGDNPEKASYQEFHRLTREFGPHFHLTPFDPRVREVTRLKRSRVFEMEFDNDHALDSGAWYKFLRSGRWRDYDYVFFIQEGTLLTRANAVSAALRFAGRKGVHFLAAGHYKERLPKSLFLRLSTRGPDSTPLDLFHDRMIRATFDLFCRDADFRALFENWRDDIQPTQQNHVPDVGNSLWDRLLYAANSDGPLPTYWAKRSAASLLRRHRELFQRLDPLLAQTRIVAQDFLPLRWTGNGNGSGEMIYVDAARRRLGEVVSTIDEEGVKFHRETEPEWHGCSCNHMLSREFLERFTEKLERHNLYEVLDLPYAGTALEVIWGFLPNWLGFEKWFFNGEHDVWKNFATYKRVDDPQGSADLINRYYRGKLFVGGEAEAVKIRRTSRECSHLREILSEDYFH